MSSGLKPGKKSAAALAALITAVAMTIVVPFVATHEGEELETYRDIAGVWTACYGDTDPEMAIPGASYTREECIDSLMRQLVAHAEPMVACVPGVTASPEITSAFLSLTYNIGSGAFCRSTVARRFNAGDYAGACEAIEMWKYANGKVVKGLVLRRADERRLCERGIPAMEAAL